MEMNVGLQQQWKILDTNLRGKTLTLYKFPNHDPQKMKILEVRSKGDDGIFVGESFSIIYCCLVDVFFVCLEETEAGWTAKEPLAEVEIGDIPYQMAFRFALSE